MSFNKVLQNYCFKLPNHGSDEEKNAFFCIFSVFFTPIQTKSATLIFREWRFFLYYVSAYAWRIFLSVHSHGIVCRFLLCLLTRHCIPDHPLLIDPAFYAGLATFVIPAYHAGSYHFVMDGYRP